MKKIVIFVLCILCLLGTCACSHEEDPFARYRDFEVSFQGEADILFGEGPSLSNYAEAIPYYTKDKTGFVGTIVPVKYRLLQTYYYAQHRGETIWLPASGIVEIVCEITDISGDNNSTSYRVGDRIVLRSSVFLRKKKEAGEKALTELRVKMGAYDPLTKLPHPLTEEEQARVDEGQSVQRKYEIPMEYVDPDDFKLERVSGSGFLTPQVSYDVLIFAEGATCTAIYAATQRENAELFETDRNIHTAGFRKYLADHRASLGLAPIEAEK